MCVCVCVCAIGGVIVDGHGYQFCKLPNIV